MALFNRNGSSTFQISDVIFLCFPQLAHVVDLHLFLGRPLKLSQKDSRAEEDGLIGSVPQLLVDDEQNFLKTAHDQSHDLVSVIVGCNSITATNQLGSWCTAARPRKQ